MNRKDILIAARDHIDNYRDVFICAALSRVAREHPEARSEARWLIRDVQEGIKHCYTLGDWLNREVGLFSMPDAMALEHLARLAWLDKLIEECPNEP